MERIKRSKLGKLVAALLLCSVVVSGMPAFSVHAENAVSDTEDVVSDTEDAGLEDGQFPETSDDLQDSQDNEAGQESQENIPAEEPTAPANGETQEAPAEDVQQENSQEQDTTEDGSLNYLYLGSSYIESSENQNIMISWGNGEENIEDMRLVYADETGKETSVEAENSEENTWLFNREFSEAETGVYTLLRLEYTDNGQASDYVFADAGMSVKFGVNKEISDSDISEHVDMETFETADDDVAASIVALSESGEEAVGSIASALGEVEQKNAEKTPALLKSKASGPSARTGNLVIVLDPGHDASHTGASDNGVREEVATLKIAQYCREELEQYGDVTVYMTREGEACPFPDTIGKSSGNILDIKERVKWASEKGADAFICFHLNSSTSSSPNGAQVFYPESSYAGDVLANEGAALANKIQQELVALGLNKRDNTPWDYAVNTESAKYGFPGLIIEHAFVSNSSDVNNYLNSDEKLKKLGIADATGIAKYFGLSKEKYVNVPEGTYGIATAVDTDKVINAESSDMTNGVEICIGENAGTSLQHFELISVGNGYYKIASEISGLVLDVDNASTDTGTAVRLFQWNNTDAQKWRFYNAGDGYYYIRSAVGTYLNLKDGVATSGNDIWMWTNDKTNACKWKLTASQSRPVENGTYTISTVLDSNKVLDIADASISDNANVQLGKNNNISSQRFEITYVGNGYYKIASEKSGRVLDVYNGSKEPGANVQQYTWNESGAQLWKFIELEDGTYYIKSMLGTVLDVHNSGTADGTNVQVYSMNGFDAQKWKLTKSEYRNVENGIYVIRAQDSKFSVLSEEDSDIRIDSFDNVKTQKFEISYDGEGYYTIKDVGTGKYLDVNNASSKPGANLHEYTGNGSDAQLWKFIENGSGGYYLKSKCGTYVDVHNTDFTDGNNVQMYTLSGGSAQKWVLDADWAQMNETPVEDGTYYIHSSLADNKVLDIDNASMKDGAKVQIFTKNSTSAQRFEISHVKDGYYKIVSEVSGKVLDVANGSTSSGTTIWQMPWNGTDAQLWRFIDGGDGSFYIKSKLGTVIDVYNADTSNGNAINAFSINGTGAQRWELEVTESRTIEDGTYVIQSSVSPFHVLSMTSSGMKIKMFDNINEQKYQISYQNNGYYRIDNVSTGKTIAVKNGSTVNQTDIVEENWTGKDNQLWKVVTAGNNQYYLKSKCGTYMDIANGTVSEGNRVWMFQGNGTSAQKWTLNSEWAQMDERPVEDGVYSISTSLNSKKVLDVANGSFSDKANIQIFTNNGTSSQRFEIVYVKDGYYKIVSELSGKVLDIANGSSSSGANIQQFTWNGTDAQLWKFLDLGDGKYIIKSKLGTVVDLFNASTADQTNISAFAFNGTNAQQWKLTSCENLVKDGTYVIANNSQNLKVLTSKDGNIQLNSFDNVKAQKYDITHIENGFYKIVDSDTGKALEVAGGSSSAKANLQEADWNGSDAQLWKFIKPSTGNALIIMSKLGTVIDVDNGELTENRNVQLFTLNGSAAQKWVLKSDWAAYDEGKIIENGTYYLNSALGNRQVIDVSNSSMSDGGNVQICEKNGFSAQRYEVRYVSDGYYRITAEHSDKVLDVSNGSAASGTNVQQMGWNGTSAQLWKFIPDGQGSYYIKSKLGTVLDVYNGTAVSRTNVWAFEMNGSNAQKWKLSDSDYQPIENSGYVMFTKQSVRLVLDAEKESGRVQLSSANETDSQLFQVDYQGKGYYRIISKSSGNVLGVKDNSEKAGAEVQQFKWDGSDGQLWKFVDCYDGTYYIKSKLGTVLEVADGEIVDGADLQMNIINNSPEQKWGLYDPDKLYGIMGETFTNVQQMAAYYKSRNSSYPYGNSDAPTIEDFCRIYIEECEIEGVKADVAFCQAMLETGFLKFGGDVKPEQYNFAGLGATGGGNPGESFPSVRIGIRAQIQHLKAYASTDDLKQECVDNRFKYVTRGCAPYVEWLGQQENPSGAGWATSKGYGTNILNCIYNLKAF